MGSRIEVRVDNTIPVGHAFIVLTDQYGAEHSWGYYPDIDGNAWGQGEVRDNADHTYDHSWSYDISETQFQAISDFIQTRSDNPGIYTGWDRNCVDFVEEALRIGGLENFDAGPAPQQLWWQEHGVGLSFLESIWNSGLEVALSVYTLFFAAFNFIQRRDPLVLDLDGDGIETVGAAATNPILFDHDNDGIRTGTGWIKSDDGLLVLDRNSNGTIDNGGELFGDSTQLSNGSLAADGFAALADQDSNHDGKVSASDAQFANLKVWRDLNQDGISQSGELFTLSSLNIASINVAHTNVTQNLGNGNTITATGAYTKTDGSTAVVGGTNLADANLVEDTFHRQFTDTIPLAPGVSDLPNMQGSGKVRDFWEAANEVQFNDSEVIHLLSAA